MQPSRPPSVAFFALVVSALGACSSSEDAVVEQPSGFQLQFAALSDGKAVGCTDDLDKFGPSAGHHIGINDLRFYVSNLHFKDKDGQEVPVTLDENEFQLASSDGSVALVDLTGNSEGSCGASSVAYAEGTARTHLAITGTTQVRRVSTVSFDAGVPQRLMKKVIAANTPEGSPSPLNEMYWNWNSGYRHFVFNFTVTDPTGAKGGGYVHLGSRDCAPSADGIKALEDRDACTYLNTATVDLKSFDLTANRVGIDVRKVVAGLDFVAPIYDPKTLAVIGEGPGVECHSSPTQPDCVSVFPSFGLDLSTGIAASANDAVFVKTP